MSSRRTFLSALGALTASSLPLGRRSILAVEAAATVFRAHPDGRQSLVRFLATGTDQPAGRLRVFDRRGQLLGTAGMLRGGDRLVGELWLAVDARTRVRSELETPGTRRPLSTWHDLTPRDRWTLYWFTLAAPGALADLLGALPPVPRAARAVALMRAGVRVHPLPSDIDPESLDHLSLLRLTVPAVQAERRFGLPLAPAALADAARGIPNVRPALAGAGVPHLITAAGSPGLLGFGRPLPEMARHLDGWLGGREDSGRETARDAVVVGTDLDAVMAMRARVDQWNTRFAYPRIVIATDVDAAARAASRPVASVASGMAAHEPDAATLGRRRDDRRRQAEEHLAHTFGPLRAAAAGNSGTLDDLAARARMPLAGSVVFNPAPFTRSGIAHGSTGDVVATNVPALGFAWIPAPEPAAPTSEDGVTRFRNDQITVEVDPADGTVRAVRTRAGLAWTGRLNEVDGATLDHARLFVQGGAHHLRLRRITFRGAVDTTVTLLDGSDTLTITNESHAVGTRPLPCTFAADMPVTTVRWELPGGMRSAPPPIRPEHLLTWLTADGPSGSMMLALPDTPDVHVGEHGTVRVQLPAGPSRILVAFREFPSETEPWRLGAEARPLAAFPAGPGGTLALPTFGRMVSVDEPGVLVAGIRQADDGVGVIVYLQETLGVPRDVPLTGELLSFEAAFLCDYAERDQQTLPVAGPSRVSVPLQRHGFTAIRLLGISLA